MKAASRRPRRNAADVLLTNPILRQAVHFRAAPEPGTAREIIS
uniref:Uncharacterized protein n=1 Tax=uncultured Armatimonadetes bacterium TaxID=157466 RepID=A0A6J4J5R1_9BACT|nr:hypothetical protein AVDCRST_MAG63-2999 [uncultured Armatimonadetes bacterium]